MCSIDPAYQYHLGVLDIQTLVPTLDLLSQNVWKWAQESGFLSGPPVMHYSITLKFEKHCFKASEDLVKMQIAI